MVQSHTHRQVLAIRDLSIPRVRAFRLREQAKSIHQGLDRRPLLRAVARRNRRVRGPQYILRALELAGLCIPRDLACLTRVLCPDTPQGLVHQSHILLEPLQRIRHSLSRLGLLHITLQRLDIRGPLPHRLATVPQS